MGWADANSIFVLTVLLARPSFQHDSAFHLIYRGSNSSDLSSEECARSTLKEFAHNLHYSRFVCCNSSDDRLSVCNVAFNLRHQ